MEYKKELEDKQMELLQCQEDMLKMRSAAQSLFSGIDESSSSSSVAGVKKKKSGVVSVADQKTVEEDSGYFQSYAHYSIHHEMLSDKVRTESYRNALLKNRDRLRDRL